MVRRRARLSPIEKLVATAGLWLVAFLVLTSIILALFESAPVISMTLFVGIPTLGAIGYFWRRRHQSRDADRKSEENHRQQLETASHIGRLLTGSGTDFERSVASVLRVYGYDLKLVGKSGDRGVDLQGTDKSGRKVVVQCKRYGPDNRVGSPAVQSFMGAVVHHGAHHGLFIVTSTFARQSREMIAGSPIGVTLIDGTAFTQMATAAAQHSATSSIATSDFAREKIPLNPNEFPTWPALPN